jgi:hypothetical protein
MGDALDNVMANNGEAAMAGAAASATATAVANRDAAQWRTQCLPSAFREGRQPSLCPCFAGAPMRRPPASPLGGDADGATAPSTLPSLGGAPPSLAGAKKSLGGTGSPSKSCRIHSRQSLRPFYAAVQISSGFWPTGPRQPEALRSLWRASAAACCLAIH